MNTQGQHMMLDIWLKKNLDFRELKNILAECLMKHRQLILGYQEWEFYPRGESCVFLIATSHASLHTYPEHKYITIDLYTCDTEIDFDAFRIDLLEKLPFNHTEERELIRGVKK